MTQRFSGFRAAIAKARLLLRDTGYMVKPDFWQGVQVAERPEAKMREILNFDFSTMILDYDLDALRADIQPNLPWADEHFEKERVSGQPINPGETWKTWPYGNSAGNFRDEQGQFNHSYAERYWPKFAHQTIGGYLNTAEWTPNDGDALRGIRYFYADLNDLIDHFARDPLTRQGYLPVWFPEDGSHNDRKPCSLGYHFIMRHGYFHVNYYIRSCDIIRHFQDDIYLTVRLQLWLLEQLRKKDDRWNEIRPGIFSMYITSLHCFVNDIPKL